MKKIATFGLLLCLLAACKEETKQKTEVTEVEKTEKKEMAYESFGEKITDANALTASELSKRYSDLEVGDTITVKVKGKIESVCQKKGCWMTIDLDKEQTAMVRFKDYGFFVPMNAADHETVVEGKAYIRETSVEELKHYGKDAGIAKAEIEKITEPKREYAFEATGVLIKK